MKRGLGILPPPSSITRQQALEYLPRTVLEEAVADGRIRETRKGRKLRFYPLREVLAVNEQLTQSK